MFKEKSSNNVLEVNIKTVVESYHVNVRGRYNTDFSTDSRDVRSYVTDVFQTGTYIEVYNFIKHFLESYHGSRYFGERVDKVLKEEMSAYRIIGSNIIAPVGSEENVVTITSALITTQEAGAKGAHAHIRSAIASLNSGEFSDSVRHSISAVESVAKVLSQDPKSDLTKALALLGKSTNIHGAMKEGFVKLYNYTSDEKGVRHSLLFADKADVDEIDALFMIGACSSFVSYLISRARDSGISIVSSE